MKLHSFILLFIIAINVKLYACDEAKKYAYDLSTHVLDIGKGKPAANLSVTLSKLHSNARDWIQITQGLTESNGRFMNFASNTEDFTVGTYKLHFETKEYYSSTNEKTLYPFIDIVFNVDNPKEHYHIPILLNAYGYTTYRGS